MTTVAIVPISDANGEKCYQAIAKAVDRGDSAKAERRASELIAKGCEKMLEMIEALEAYTRATAGH